MVAETLAKVIKVLTLWRLLSDFYPRHWYLRNQFLCWGCKTYAQPILCMYNMFVHRERERGLVFSNIIVFPQQLILHIQCHRWFPAWDTCLAAHRLAWFFALKGDLAKTTAFKPRPEQGHWRFANHPQIQSNKATKRSLLFLIGSIVPLQAMAWSTKGAASPTRGGVRDAGGMLL